MQYLLHLQINAYMPFTSHFTALPLYYSCNSTHASSTSSTATHCNIGCNTLQHRLQYLKHEYTLHENTQQHMLQCVAVRCSAHMLHICCSAHMLQCVAVLICYIYVAVLICYIYVAVLICYIYAQQSMLQYFMHESLYRLAFVPLLQPHTRLFHICRRTRKTKADVLAASHGIEVQSFAR